MTDEGRFYCTHCDFNTVSIFYIGCPEPGCRGSLFLPIDENPEFHKVAEPGDDE